MNVSSLTRPVRIVVLPGDGIGPEVTTAAVAVLRLVATALDVDIHLDERPVGGAAIESHGVPLPEPTLELCREADAVVFGAVGAPHWDHLRGDARPGAATLRLRHELGLRINLRPVRAIPALAAASPLRPEVIEATDFAIVRELTGGAYYGAHGRDGQGEDERAFDTITYSRAEISAAVSFAFQLARTRRHRLTSVDKANVLWSGRLWRDVTNELAGDFPDVTVDHRLVDSFSLRMLQRPAELDVVVAENLIGDILSDEAAAISGSLGVMASASMNPAGGPALYEPIHGSAPEIAGQGIANPLGAILSVAMLFEHSLGDAPAAASIRDAVDSVLNSGIGTPDIGGTASTTSVTDAVLDAVTRLQPQLTAAGR